MSYVDADAAVGRRSAPAWDVEDRPREGLKTDGHEPETKR
jgi:hypothetical protein